MTATDRDYAGLQEFRAHINARFDAIAVQLNDLREQVTRITEQLARIVELMTENTDIQKRQLGLLEASQRSQDQ